METADINTLLASETRGDTIALLLADSVTDVDVLAAYTLKEKFGERAFIINTPKNLEEKWKFLFKNPLSTRKEIVIALNIEKKPIEDLRYEKVDGFLKIYLTPQHPVSKEDFTFEEAYPMSDLVIAIGFGSDEELKNALKDIPHKNSGAVIRIGNSKPQLQLNSVQQLPHHDDSAHTIPHEQWSQNAMKLWARAFLRSYTEEDLNVFWAFLPKEDFVKTSQSYEILPQLIESMKQFTSLPAIAIILWEEEGAGNQRVKALIHSEQKERLQRIANAFNTTLSGSGLYCITAGYPNFSEAEIEIRKLLKKVQ